MTAPAWRFTVPPLSGNAIRLLLTSATILFVELVLIRWVNANVVYIGFFSNFLLMASFLGIGVGILVGRGGRRIPILPFALLLFAVVVLVYGAQLNVQVESTDELFFGLAESQSADVNFLVLPLVVVLVTGLLAALATPLGPLLRSMPPLRAYAIDIIGSLCGIALFVTLSASGTDPLIWFGVAAILVVLMELGAGFSAWSLVSVVALAAVLFTVNRHLGPMEARYDSYSPYYRISLTRYSDGQEHIGVNGIPHQALHPLGAPGWEPFYHQVYEWFPERTFDEVLVVGAGSGVGRGAGPRTRRRPRRCRRDRPGHPAHRHRAAPGPALRQRTGRPIRQRRPSLPAPTPTSATTSSSSRCRIR